MTFASFFHPGEGRGPDAAGVMDPGLRRGGWHIGVGVAMALLIAAPALADSDLPAAPWANVQLPNAAQEAKAKALMETIRCLVCQGQAVSDSDAELAGDMRNLIRERIARGESPDAVRAWLVQRYGAWVTYDPPLGATTWLLWLAPLLFVVGGVLVARGSFRRRRR